MTEEEMDALEAEGKLDANEAPDGMLGAKPHKHEFCVLNLTSKPLTGTVSWLSGGNEIPINVNGLAPCTLSERKAFTPMGGHRDLWKWSGKGRKYQLNAYKTDRFAVVAISDYGLSVLVTSTSPDTWKW